MRKPAGIPRLSSFDPRSRKLLRYIFNVMAEGYDSVVLRGKEYTAVLFKDRGGRFAHYILIMGRNDGMKTNFAVTFDDAHLAHDIERRIYENPVYVQESSEYQNILVKEITERGFGLDNQTVRAQGDLTLFYNSDLNFASVVYNLNNYLVRRVEEKISETLNAAGFINCRQRYTTIIPTRGPLSFLVFDKIITKVQLYFKIIIEGQIIPLRLWIERHVYHREAEGLVDEAVGTWAVRYETPNSKGTFYYFSGIQHKQLYYGKPLYHYFELGHSHLLTDIEEIAETIIDAHKRKLQERFIWVGRHKVTVLEPAPLTIIVEDSDGERVEIPAQLLLGRGAIVAKKLIFEHPEHGKKEIELQEPSLIRLESYVTRQEFEEYRRLANHFAAERFLKNSHS